jgi:hypothetical protein
MSSEAALTSTTLVDLALLGLLTDRARRGAVIIQAVRALGGDHFRPTAAFVEDRLVALIGQGFVTAGERDDDLYLSADGPAHLIRLLRLELDPGASVLQAFCMSLKLCLLDLVGPEARGEIAGALCRSRDCCPMSRDCRPPHDCPRMRRYLAIEERRLAHERRWLDDMLIEEGIVDAIP